ncbi:MAG: putative RNA uridine N3 methyltransferase [Candidatus Hodarchaeota archaeon]
MCESKNDSIKILLPNDILKNINHLMHKTLVLGNIARFCSIFKVNEIIIYDSGETWKQKGFDISIIEDVLSYLATPQYLRKKIFVKQKTLAYAGVLPPLNTPNHPREVTERDEIFKEEKPCYRVGRIERVTNDKAWIDVGLSKEVELKHTTDVKLNQLVNLKMMETGQGITCNIIDESEVPFYWGYKITIKREGLHPLLSNLKKSSVLIATSKHGDNYKDLTQEGAKKNLDFTGKNITVVFGPRSTGLIRFFKSFDKMMDNFDLIINLFPDPGTKSIRLEEAIPIALFFIQKIKKNRLENSKI